MLCGFVCLWDFSKRICRLLFGQINVYIVGHLFSCACWSIKSCVNTVYIYIPEISCSHVWRVDVCVLSCFKDVWKMKDVNETTRWRQCVFICGTKCFCTKKEKASPCLREGVNNCDIWKESGGNEDILTLYKYTKRMWRSVERDKHLLLTSSRKSKRSLAWRANRSVNRSSIQMHISCILISLPYIEADAHISHLFMQLMHMWIEVCPGCLVYLN